MSSNSRISIAMATYNGSKYLPEQLQSLLVQTRLPDEVVITDDCSTDETFQVIRQFAGEAPFDVFYSRNDENLGYSGNFNAALMQTTGDLVFLCDQDDVWFPEKIAHIESIAVENPDILLFMNDAILTDDELNSVALTKLGQMRSAGFKDTGFVMGCCCAVRRELLDMCMPVPVGYNGHDHWIVQLADRLNAKLISEEAMQYYRRHSTNESQIIANRTRRITRWDFMKEQLGSFFAQEQNRQLKSDQLTLLSQGIARAIQRSHDRYISDLEEMLEETERSIRLITERSAIRDKKFFCRVRAAAIYWSKGHYEQASGIMSLMRDIIG